MPVLERESFGLPAWEAEENLRIIRDLMERSTRYSTFSGPSGILAGSLAILGCLLHGFWAGSLSPDSQSAAIMMIWSMVIIGAIGSDYVLTKRRARFYGKHIVSHLGRQIISASAPGLGMGVVVTLYLLSIGRLSDVFPFWMLSYGAAVSAVGLFSQAEVRKLGRAFVITGVATLLIKLVTPAEYWAAAALLLTAVSFGGFHIAYGIAVTGRDDH